MNRSSAYMEWAKLHSGARFNLATSGILSVPAAEFPATTQRYEITAPGAYGYQPLLEKIAAHVGVSADCVVTAAGTSMANHLALAASLSAGDEILLEEPTYGLLLDLAQYLGLRVRRFQRRAENDFAIDLDELIKIFTPATRMIVLTNLHNPTGALVANQTLDTLADLAEQNRAHVLLDEVYFEMLWRRRTSPPRPQFLITNSLTKAYGLSGLRCGWIIATPELAQRIWRLNDLFGVNGAHPAEQMSALAFDHLEFFRARTEALLAANRPLLDRFLDARTDLDCFRPPGGTVVFPRLLQGAVESLVRQLRTQFEVSVVPGTFFEKPEHFRIGIGGPTEDLRQGLERLGAALDQLRS